MALKDYFLRHITDESGSIFYRTPCGSTLKVAEVDIMGDKPNDILIRLIPSKFEIYLDMMNELVEISDSVCSPPNAVIRFSESGAVVPMTMVKSISELCNKALTPL